MKYLPICMLLYLSSNIMGQSVCADFIIHSTVDNIWSLHLRKNRTYTYTHWSSFGASSTLDSGTYLIEDNSVKLFSDDEEYSGKYLQDSYYIEKVKLKKQEGFDYIQLSKDERFSFFGNNYLVLTKLPFDYSKIISTNPEDKIGIDTIPIDVSLIEFIEAHRFKEYYINSEDISNCDTCWITVYKSNTLTIINVDNKDEVYYNGFITGDRIYDTNLDINMQVQEIILDRLKNEKVITKSQQLEILELLEQQLKERQHWFERAKHH